MVVAHYIPFRAIRAGKQLSDSKGASAAISTEAAILAINRSMRGFIGPKDIFRNPAALFRLNEPTQDDSCPFDIKLGFSGDDFAVMGMHFKLGLYEHQSAGAIHAVVKLIFDNKFVQKGNFDKIKSIKVLAYEPCFHIIGDPEKRNPTTRQSADHSMVYILSTLLKRAFDHEDLMEGISTFDDLWKRLMLGPFDYSNELINDTTIRALMDKVEFEHGGPSYDEKYPDGIPTSVIITLDDGTTLDSGLVLYPKGHARNTCADLQDILDHKFRVMGALAAEQTEVDRIVALLGKFETLSNADLRTVYNCTLQRPDVTVDGV